MGTTTAPVAPSGGWPAWIAPRLEPQARAGTRSLGVGSPPGPLDTGHGSVTSEECQQVGAGEDADRVPPVQDEQALSDSSRVAIPSTGFAVATVAIGGPITELTARPVEASPDPWRACSSSWRSETDPTTSARASGGSALTTGTC